MRAEQAALGKLSGFMQPYFYGWDLRLVLGLQTKSLNLKWAIENLTSASFILWEHRVWLWLGFPSVDCSHVCAVPRNLDQILIGVSEAD